MNKALALQTTIATGTPAHHPSPLRARISYPTRHQVNIDSKLVQNTVDQDTVELQNGCMCCTMADELFTSVAQLVSLAQLRDPDRPYDHIVIEGSGVSEPRAVRDNFQDAEAYNMALLDSVGKSFTSNQGGGGGGGGGA